MSNSKLINKWIFDFSFVIIGSGSVRPKEKKKKKKESNVRVFQIISKNDRRGGI